MICTPEALRQKPIVKNLRKTVLNSGKILTNALFSNAAMRLVECNETIDKNRQEVVQRFNKTGRLDGVRRHATARHARTSGPAAAGGLV